MADCGNDAGWPPGVLVKRRADRGTAGFYHPEVSRWEREGSYNNQRVCSRCVCVFKIWYWDIILLRIKCILLKCVDQ